MFNSTFMGSFMSMLLKLIPANNNLTSDSNFNNMNNLNGTMNVKNFPINNALNLTAEFCASYKQNYSRVEDECLIEVMVNLNYTKSQDDIMDLLERSFYIRKNHKDVRCWAGCVCKKMLLLNATNAVVDEQLEIFTKVLVNDTHTEDEIDEECSDLENVVRGLDYCDMGFKLYNCIFDQLFDFD